MILQLPFKTGFSLYREKPVEIILNIGTLEDLCDSLGIKFYELPENITTDILYFGYLTACQKAYRKPKYSKEQAEFWADHMSASALRDYTKLLTDLFGKAQDMTESDDKKKGK